MFCSIARSDLCPHRRPFSSQTTTKSARDFSSGSCCARDITCRSSPQPTRCCRRARPTPPDLVVIDLVARARPRASRSSPASEGAAEHALHSHRHRHVAERSSRAPREASTPGADDFVSKPFDVMELHARIQSLVRLKRYTDELESAEAVILGLGATIEARDPTTQGHCERLASYARRWAIARASTRRISARSSAAAISTTSARSRCPTPCC